MSNERPDEFLSWRTKLTQPDALPEQGLDDPESAWQQLYARLGEKPRRRLFYWYGAAACLLLALIPAALLFRPASGKHPGNTLRQASAIHPSPSTIRSTASTSSSGSVSSVSPPSDHRRPPPKSGIRPAAIVPLIPAGPTPITLVPPSPGQGLQLAQQPPIKKTLRVVSINELDTPPAMGPALTLERSSAPFRIHIHLDKDLLRQVSADRGADPEFLKLKIPLQNP